MKKPMGVHVTQTFNINEEFDRDGEYGNEEEESRHPDDPMGIHFDQQDIEEIKVDKSITVNKS
jgi:hypothetical protein